MSGSGYSLLGGMAGESMLIRNLEKHGPFNIFVGAGVSKLPPAYAPVWKEMLSEFSKALFMIMRNEKWPGVGGSEADVDALQRFGFRPETFWERILQQADLSFISGALHIVNLGKPNLNHRTISELVARGVITNVVTTNFDEYLDVVLADCARRVVSPGDLEGVFSRGQLQAGRAVYFKLHGTISDSQSLRFTLEHTRRLPDWKAALLSSCLANCPLLIAGYSGFDDDVMPRLFEVATEVPQVVIVCYPGSDPNEPIRDLGHLPHVTIVESDISRELRLWMEQEIRLGHSAAELLEDLPSPSAPPSPLDHYLHLLSRRPIPLIPLIVSSLFELAANRDLARKYAWLADDAREDPRYTTTVSRELSRRVLANLSLHMATTGDQRWSYNLLDEASRFDNRRGPISKTTLDHLNRVFEYFQCPRLSERQEEEIESRALGALAMVNLGVIRGDIITFRACWCMGRLRRRQNSLAEALEFYRQAGSPPEGLDDIQRSCFWLDFGCALLIFSAINRDSDALTNAMRLLAHSERIAVRASDHQTAAKAKMNLSQAHYFCGEGDIAMTKAIEAKERARLTGDRGLQARVEKLIAEMQRQSGRE